MVFKGLPFLEAYAYTFHEVDIEVSRDTPDFISPLQWPPNRPIRKLSVLRFNLTLQLLVKFGCCHDGLSVVVVVSRLLYYECTVTK